MPRRALVLLAGLCLLSSSASGAPTPEALRGELQARTSARDDARAEAARLRDEIARLNAQLGELKAVQSAGQAGVSAKRARLAALNAREAALRDDMGQNQTALARLLGALELYRRSPPPALLVTPASAKDAVRAQILLRAVEPELARRAAEFRARAEELQRMRRSITNVSEDLFTSESALAEGRASIEQAIREKTALERQLDADAVDAGRRAQALADQLKAVGASINGPAARDSGRAPASFVTPVSGTLVRRFGQPAPDGGVSDGLAWRTAGGAEVRAPAAGVVEYSGALKGWGGVLIVNVGGGYHLVLAGLDRISAAAGRPVAAGQPLGAMAAQAPVPPELYLEVRKDGAPTDPGRWFGPGAGR